MKTTLTVTPELFTQMISGLIASGVTFEAENSASGKAIIITFLGGY